MATDSFPAVGNGGLSELQWSKLFDAPDGVVEDPAGTGLTLTRIASDTCRIGVGMGRIQGYFLEVTSNHDLTTVAPGSGSTTWTIAIQYDPSLNVADGSGNSDPLGPCRLIAVAGALDTSGGKKYLILYQFTRAAGQAITAVTVTDYRHWAGAATVEWPWGLATPTGGEFNLPRGSLRYDSINERLLVWTMNRAGSAMEWRAFESLPAASFPTASGLIAQDTPAQYWVGAGLQVNLRGTLKRASGASLSTGSEVILGTMPNTPLDLRPPALIRWTATAGNTGAGWTIVGGKVLPDTGQVIMYDPPGSATVAFIDLSSISYRAKA